MNGNSFLLSRKQLGWIASLALAGFVTVMVKIGYLLIIDKAFCIGQGCEIVESMLKIPPLWFNYAGGAFFIFLFVTAWWARRHSPTYSTMSRKHLLSSGLLRVLLICAVAAEGVLISYQWFVVQVFCSYCLLIFAFIVFMNIIAGWRQACLGFLILSSEIIIFSLLQFNNPAMDSGELSLADGTYAVKHSSVRPGRQLYFIFSEDCPHCHNVFEVLERTVSCEVKFNPLNSIEQSPIPGLVYNEVYDLAINRKILKLLDVNTIPVLIEKRNDGVEFIRGGKQIISFLEKYCLAVPGKGEGSNKVSAQDPAFDLEPGECRVGEICAGDEADKGVHGGERLWDFQ